MIQRPLFHSIAAAMAMASAVGPSTGMAGDSAVLLDALPPPVAAATWCADDGPGFATRRNFAGHVIFAVECPGNNANFMQALVVADDAEGRYARSLVFPTPYPPVPNNPNDVLSNIEWLDGDIVSELFVDPEEIGGPCRHEARWRLDGAGPQPVLVFWRETKDCDGTDGWTVLVGG